ncbi:MAG: ABC transporter ATP-binding protein [Chloroflexi bacterium]|nr:ABC transporter ATP-binding protein [Chloroflexota bacterium]
MSDIAVQVEGLGKRYRIGVQEEKYDTLGAQMLAWLRSPLTNYQRLRSLSRFSGNGQAEDVIWALKDISFTVKEGEALGVIGRNGAGKSTLLKVLSRITPPTSGRVLLSGRVASLLEVGTGFHPELTGRENVYLNGSVLGMTKAEIDRKFDEIVAFSGVEKFIDTPVKRYSSGMRVRLAFSVAAHLEPEILLIDEVLAVGDAEFQRKCLGKMQDAAGAGRTVIFVSHNMPAVTRLCQRALLLEGGRLVSEGPAEQVVAEYLVDATQMEPAKTWTLAEAPGTDELRLISVSLLNEQNRSVSVVSVEEELHLRIGYLVNQPGLTFRCAARFYTQGVCAFATVEPSETVRERAGDYYSVVKIPPHLLNEGEYVVGVSIFSSGGRKMHYVLENDVISFHVHDPITGNSARGDYTEPFGGVMRPRLEWDMVQADYEELRTSTDE